MARYLSVILILAVLPGCAIFHFDDQLAIQDLSEQARGAPVPVTIHMDRGCEQAGQRGGAPATAPLENFNRAFSMALQGSGLVTVTSIDAAVLVLQVECQITRSRRRPASMQNPFLGIPYMLIGGPIMTDGRLNLDAQVRRPDGDTVMTQTLTESYTAHHVVLLSPLGIFQPFIGTGFGRETQVMAAKMSTNLLSTMADNELLAQTTLAGTPNVVDW